MDRLWREIYHTASAEPNANLALIEDLTGIG